MTHPIQTTGQPHTTRHLAILEDIATLLMATLRAAAAQPNPTPAEQHAIAHLARTLHQTILLEQRTRTPPRPNLTKADHARLKLRRDRIQAHAERIIKAEAPHLATGILPRQIRERLDDNDLTDAIDNNPVHETAIQLCQHLGLAKDTSNWPHDLQQALQSMG
jgi:hypothetical protein